MAKEKRRDWRVWPRRRGGTGGCGQKEDGLEGAAKEEELGGCGQGRRAGRVWPRKKSWEGVAKEQKDGVTEEVCKKEHKLLRPDQ